MKKKRVKRKNYKQQQNMLATCEMMVIHSLLTGTSFCLRMSEFWIEFSSLKHGDQPGFCISVICYFLAIAPDKKEYQVSIFSYFLHENIYGGNSLEVPHRGTSNEYLPQILNAKIRKILSMFLYFQNVKSDLIKLVHSIGFNISDSGAVSRTSKEKDLDFVKGDVLEISKYTTTKTLESRTIVKIKAVLLAGLYPNIAKVSYTPRVDAAVNTEQTACVGDSAQGPVHVHPSSVNRFLQANGWLVFHQKVSKSSTIFT